MAFRYFQQMGKQTQELFVKRLTILGQDALDYAFILVLRKIRKKEKKEYGLTGLIISEMVLVVLFM